MRPVSRAGVAELADASDSKSDWANPQCGFESHRRHHETDAPPGLGYLPLTMIFTSFSLALA